MTNLKTFERGQGLVEYALIIVLIAVVVIVIAAVLRDTAIESQDVYEQAYDKCIARETISAERCHDIALMEAYPSQSTVVQPVIRP